MSGSSADRLPFTIKICGVKTVEDVEAVAAAGGDAIGLNFFPPSVRFLEIAAAGRLASLAKQNGILPIALFVNESRDAICRLVGEIDVQWIQLHGDEPPELATQLIADGYQILRAVRLPTGSLTEAEIEARLVPWRELGCTLLLDADAGKNFGGQGKALDWQGLRLGCTLPFVLAGGLTPENVGQAIVGSGAQAVDVASGVEAPRGCKSAEKIQRFCQQARSVW